MIPFNANHPKYIITCCCGIHVAKLARIFMSVDIVGNIITGRIFLCIPFIILSIGVYGVFKQARLPLLVHIVLRIVCCLYLLEYAIYPDAFQDSPEIEIDPEIFNLLVFMTISIETVFIVVYWNMAKFIYDNENFKRPNVGIACQSVVTKPPPPYWATI